MTEVLKLTLSESRMKHIEDKQRVAQKRALVGVVVSRQDIIYELIDADILIHNGNRDTYSVYKGRVK